MIYVPTPRERELLERWARGMVTAEIAEDLGISPNTVKRVSERIYRKLRARNRAHAVAIAYQREVLRVG